MWYFCLFIFKLITLILNIFDPFEIYVYSMMSYSLFSQFLRCNDMLIDWYVNVQLKWSCLYMNIICKWETDLRIQRRLFCGNLCATYLCLDTKHVLSNPSATIAYWWHHEFKRMNFNVLAYCKLCFVPFIFVSIKKSTFLN